MENKNFKPLYHLTDEQIAEYQKWTFKEIITWLETTNEFLYKMRSDEAKEFNRKIRSGEIKRNDM